MRLFKKTEEDPFAFVHEEEEKTHKEKAFLSRIRSSGVEDRKGEAGLGDETEYSSPFRSAEERRAAEQRKKARAPVDVSAMGFNVVDDKVKRSKDIIVPTRLKETEADQAIRLQELEKKEKELRYFEECQVIEDIREERKTEQGLVLDKQEDEDEGNDVVELEKEPGAEVVVDAMEDAEAIALNEEDDILDNEEDLQGEPKAGAVVRAFEEAEAIVQDEPEDEPVDETVEPSAAVASEALEEAEAIVLGEEPVESELVNEEKKEELNEFKEKEQELNKDEIDISKEAKPDSAVRAFEEAEAIVQDEIEEPIDLSKEPKPDATVRAFEEVEAIVQDDLDEGISDLEAEPKPETTIVALQEAEALATGELTTNPPDISSAPLVPFNMTVSKGDDKSGLFGFLRKHKNVEPVVSQREGPIATPDDPDYIVLSNDGYLSKVIHEKIQFDEIKHQSKLDDLSKKSNEKYETKSKEYEEKIKSIEAQIAELNADMEQLKLDHNEKLKLKEVEASQVLMKTNNKHITAKTEMYKETEQIKQSVLQDKSEVEDKDVVVNSEIDELNLSKAAVLEDNQQHEDRVNALTTDLDTKVSELNESLAKKEEINAEIEALNQQKAELEQAIKDESDHHQKNMETIEGIDNKTYLPKIDAINVQISTLLTSLALLQQETSNQKVEFSNITKKLAKEREEQALKLQQEKEERERKEQERLENQRQEYERQAEETRLKHEEEINQLNTSLEEEKKQRDLAERQRTRLQGEKAIQEQERGNPEDKKLQAEFEDKQKRQAEASAAAHAAIARNNNVNQPSKNATSLEPTDSSLYDYETIEEVITVD